MRLFFFGAGEGLAVCFSFTCFVSIIYCFLWRYLPKKLTFGVSHRIRAKDFLQILPRSNPLFVQFQSNIAFHNIPLMQFAILQ